VTIVTDEDKTPGLDEQTFGKLVEAAYVLQEHNREIRAMEESLELHSEQLRQQESALQAQFQIKKQEAPDSIPPGDYTLTLAEIVEAQHQIQRRHLTLEPAMEVVAERVARITNASGAAIGLLEGKVVCYRAGTGAPALPLGSEVSLDSAICAASVRTGQVIRSEDVSLEFLFDAEGCMQRGIQSLLSVPIYHDGDIVGALELYFDKMRGFAEQDIHTCQLMAGLVTEAIGRDAESSLKKSMASERSTMLAAIEKLKPNLAALADQAAAIASAGKAGSAPMAVACWKCGSPVLAVEQFCGKCGAVRTNDGEPSDTQNWDMQTKFASAWRSQQESSETASGDQGLLSQGMGPASGQRNGNNEQGDLPGEETTDYPLEPFSLLEWDESHPEPNGPVATKANPGSWSHSAESQPDTSDVDAPAAALVRLEPGDGSWTSAAKAREFLEELASTQSPSALARFWQARRGNFYLAVAVILVLVVIRWGILSDDHAVGASSHGGAPSGNVNQHKPAPDADLSTFDKFLISLGLADPPEAPAYKGNPDTRVWVDLHTALYYCPDSDLYGRTPKGRFASQRDAQLDQFEPASRKACE